MERLIWLRGIAIIIVCAQYGKASAARGSREKPSTVAVSTHDDTLTVEVSSAADFLRVEDEYSRLKYSNNPTVTNLDVILHAGDYKSRNLELGLLEESNVQIKVRLRSADPRHPAVLNVQVSVEAADITIEDIIFRDVQLGAPLLQLYVRNKLTIQRCGFSNNFTWGLRNHGQALITIAAAHEGGTKPALIEDTWFEHNGSFAGSPMIAYEGIAPTHFASIRFDRTVFFENSFSSALDAIPTFDLQLHDCLFVANSAHPPAQLAGLIANAQLTVDDSMLFLKDWSALARFQHSPPAKLHGSTVYVAGGAAPPPEVSPERVTVLDASKGTDILSRLKRIVQRAGKSVLPTGPALRRALGL